MKITELHRTANGGTMEPLSHRVDAAIDKTTLLHLAIAGVRQLALNKEDGVAAHLDTLAHETKKLGDELTGIAEAVMG